MTDPGRVVGLDLSLTATGWACDCGTGVIKVKSKGWQRLQEIGSAVIDHAVGVCSNSGEALVVIEGYSFASKVGGERMGELGGVVRYLLGINGCPFVEVPPSVLKLFTLGKGGGEATGKDAMLAAAIRKFGFEGNDNNEADAWMLRCMGLARYEPTEMGDAWAPTLPQVRALEKVEWPDG